MGRNVTGFSRIDSRDLQWIDAEGVGAQVDGLLHRPFRRWIAKTAEGAGGNLVGIDQLGFYFHIGILVAGVMAHRRDAGYRRRLGGVGAVVGNDFQFFGANAAVFFEAQLDVDLHEHARPATG